MPPKKKGVTKKPKAKAKPRAKPKAKKTKGSGLKLAGSGLSLAGSGLSLAGSGRVKDVAKKVGNSYVSAVKTGVKGLLGATAVASAIGIPYYLKKNSDWQKSRKYSK